MAAKNDILIDKDGNQIFPATMAEQVSYDGKINVKQAIKRGAVRNKVAPTVESMTDKEQIYVYTGTEDGYTFGNWYYWDGTAWTSGGAYNAIEVNTDGTLTEEGAPADAKATGDKLTELKEDLYYFEIKNVIDTEIEKVIGKWREWNSLQSSKTKISYFDIPLISGDVVSIVDDEFYIEVMYKYPETHEKGTPKIFYGSATTMSKTITEDGLYTVVIADKKGQEVAEAKLDSNNICFKYSFKYYEELKNKVDNIERYIDTKFSKFTVGKWIDGNSVILLNGSPLKDMDTIRDDMELIFYDDFDILDESIWNVQDSKGYNYTNINYYDPSCVSVEYSNLVLSAEKLESSIDVNGITCTWKSGAVNTHSKKTFDFGRIDAKIKIPKFDGSFPAFWALGQTENTPAWPMNGEIDIFELKGNKDNVTCGMIYGTEKDVAKDLGRVDGMNMNMDGYHIYSLIRSSNTVTILIDDVVVTTVDISDSSYDCFRNPMYLILNLAIDKSFGTPQVDEAKMYIDWVRCYQ